MTVTVKYGYVTASRFSLRRKIVTLPQAQIAFMFPIIAVFPVAQKFFKFVSLLSRFCQHHGNINP